MQDLFSVADPDSEIIIVGTRWHFDDCYNFIEREINPKLPEHERYTIEVETLWEKDSDGGIDHSRLRFPEKYTEEVIRRLQIEKGLLEFAAQYENNPLPEGSTVFGIRRLEQHLFDVLDPSARGIRVATYWDPATSEEKRKHVCYSAIVTAAHDPDMRRYYVLDATVEKMDVNAGIRELMKHVLTWGSTQIGIESTPLLTEKVENEIRDRELEGHVPRVTDIPHHRISKAARIEALDPIFNGGHLWFRRDFQSAYPRLVDQFVTFPLHEYRDGPDALAGVIELLQLGHRKFGAANRKQDDTEFFDIDSARKAASRPTSERMQRARSHDAKSNIHPRLRYSLDRRLRKG